MLSPATYKWCYNRDSSPLKAWSLFFLDYLFYPEIIRSLGEADRAQCKLAEAKRNKVQLMSSCPYDHTN